MFNFIIHSLNHVFQIYGIISLLQLSNLYSNFSINLASKKEDIMETILLTEFGKSRANCWVTIPPMEALITEKLPSLN